MTTTTATPRGAAKATLQIATFYVDHMLLGLEISQIQEINRHLEVTSVPHAPDFVRGVINLRGEVVTVVEMRTLLGLRPAESTSGSRIVVIHFGGELVGLMVDRIGDVLAIAADEIDPPPANVQGVDERFLQGVYVLESDIVVILDVSQILVDGSNSFTAQPKAPAPMRSC